MYELESNPHFRSLQPQNEDHLPLRGSQSRMPQSPQQPGHHHYPLIPGAVRPEHGDRRYQPSHPQVQIQEPPLKPLDPWLQPPKQLQKDQHFQPRTSPALQPHHVHGHSRPHGLRGPKPQKTKPYTWLGAIFCVIFWLIIILGGLIVLIIYLVFRPKSPHFNVSSATLNAAYLDMGYLLNADLTVLANITNPNRKVKVDFSSMFIDLYYGSTLIATQYIPPFSASKAQSKFADIHMVTSQVSLPLKESQQLRKQMQSNGVLFDVKGRFRARSSFGSILRYSYWLYGHCSIKLTGPPDGVLVESKCRTKR
ncbi:Late embryogenesis abundant protein [Quillaja saponaria]|uniref:Late embryogenesis abundant protein n=1 Tax=Quillaja saponaria TaxID=32244 RepID=A0AAD7PIT0_QUISA|nr:Late embryogenesis abundant protein [Quillaja saponaria]